MNLELLFRKAVHSKKGLRCLLIHIIRSSYGNLFVGFTIYPLYKKSLHRSRAWRHFYGTENEIWAGWGWLAILKENNWVLIISNF